MDFKLYGKSSCGRYAIATNVTNDGCRVMKACVRVMSGTKLKDIEPLQQVIAVTFRNRDDFMINGHRMGLKLRQMLQVDDV